MLKNTLQRDSISEVVVVGAGLAGSECAWQLAEMGHKVCLIEQRPVRTTAAPTGPLFAELVCSNSLKSMDPDSAPQMLKQELADLNSLVLKAAYKHQVAAGQALGVNREKFSEEITRTLERHANIKILREAVTNFEELTGSGPNGLRPIVFATGPLTSEDLADNLATLTGQRLFFFDAIAPIVAGESIDRSIAFEQNRYDKNTPEGQDGDYLNCPLSEEEYYAFIDALSKAERVDAHNFEKIPYFQGCQPIEALLDRGPKTLAFGPMKPVGLMDKRTEKRPYAVVQLRKEDSEGRAWNMVGFQTKLKYPEQQRIFRMIPGLKNAEFYRLGSLHRNTYILSPAVLDSQFRLKTHPSIYFAGQITGVEGYLESCAIGALVGRLIGLKLRGIGQAPLPPATTALGALAEAIVNGRVKNFQPMNINWGLVPLLDIGERDADKKPRMVARGRRQFGHWLSLF